MRWQIATGRCGLKRPPILAALALVLLAIGWPSSVPARADAPDWEATSLTGKALRLFTPASGALFVQVDDDLYRSDDAGDRWTTVELPPPRLGQPSPPAAPYQFTRRIAIDPTNRNVLFTNGESGLYRTPDGGGTWVVVLGASDRVWHPDFHPPKGADVISIAVSPADPRLVYVGLRNGDSQFQFLRSSDNGVTWDQLAEQYYSLCTWIIWVLEPHPIAPGRLFRTATCAAGRSSNSPLNETTDRGETWTTRFGSIYAGGDGERYLTPKYLIGGAGTAPSRFYMAAQRDFRFGGSALLRSDDDASTWTEILTYSGGGTDWQRQVAPDMPELRIAGLAYDPAQPDRVYAMINERRGYLGAQTWLGSWLQASRDGGASWTVLNDMDIGTANDLALSVNGATLYAATDQGVFRMHLTP